MICREKVGAHHSRSHASHTSASCWSPRRQVGRGISEKQVAQALGKWAADVELSEGRLQACSMLSSDPPRLNDNTRVQQQSSDVKTITLQQEASSAGFCGRYLKDRAFGEHEGHVLVKLTLQLCPRQTVSSIHSKRVQNDINCMPCLA